MAKKHGYPLPEDNNPENHKCVLVKIPDDVNHQRAFWGHLHELSMWWNWDRDEAHNGTLAAARWREIWHESLELFIETEGACAEVVPGCANMIYGIRTVDCVLEVQWEEGGEWVEVGDFSLCGAQGPEGEKGDTGDTGPTGATGPQGEEGDSSGDPDGEGGVPDPTAGAGVTDLPCAVATGVADKAVDILLEALQQRQLDTIFAEVLLLAGAILISGPVGIVAALLGGAYGVWTVQDAEDAEQELDQDWRTEAKCRLYCILGEDASITRAVLDEWGEEMEDFSANAGAKFAETLDGVAVSALRNEANLAALTDESCVGCDCGWEHVIDFTLTDGDFYVVELGGYMPGVWQSGTGWVGTKAASNEDRGVHIQLDVEADLTDVLYVVSHEHTDNAFSHRVFVWTGDDYSFPDEFNGPGEDTYGHGVDSSVTWFRLYASAGYQNTWENNPILKSVTFRGTGDNPFD